MPPLPLIGSLAWNDMPHAPTGVLYVPRPSRDEVYVAVEDRLTSNLAAVHPNIEPSDCRVAF